MESNFKIDPIWKHKDVLGLDLGTRFLKVVQLEKKGKLTKLVGYGKTKVPENYIIEGIVSEPEKLAETVKDLISNKVWGKITAKRVNLSLPESKIYTRLLTLPHMKEKDLAEAISWEAGQSIPMALTDLYLDWQVIGPSQADPKNDEIIFAAAPKAIVDSYMQFFKEMDFEPYSVETSLNAITRAMIPSRDKDETVMVIDLGGETANMAIFDHVIRVTSSTLLNGDSITQKVEDLSAIKSKEGKKLVVGRSTEEITDMKRVIESNVSNVTAEAMRIIHYYNEKINKDNTVQKIFLCGGNATLPNLTDIISEKMGIPCLVGNPWSNISIYPIKSVPKSEAPSYTNAIGLALLGVEND